MKPLIPVLALSGTVLLAGIGLMPASAQKSAEEFRDKCPAGVAMAITGPQAVQYSWGVEVGGDEGPMRSYTWAELAGFGAPQNGSPGTGPAEQAQVTLNGPRAVHYSWGVQMLDDDGPVLSYTWAALEQLRGPQSASIGQPPSADELKALLNPESRCRDNN